MNTKIIGTWSFFIGMILALTTVFVDLGAWIIQTLIILGILTGLFHKKIKKELVPFGIIYLGLAAVSSSMDRLILFGPYISDIVSAWVRFLGPVLLTAFVIWGGTFLVVNKEN
jgi:hypothetical protein